MTEPISDADDRAFQERVPVRHAARMAVAALLDGDDGEAAERLAFLDAGQLKQVEDAAVALSLHAHRARQNIEKGTP